MTLRVVGGWVSITNAAKRLGVSRPVVYALAATGKLTFEKVADRPVVTVESLEKLVAERQS